MTIEWKRLICLTSLLLIPFSAHTAVPKVAAGSGHTVALKPDGTVLTWGFNFVGELGAGADSGRRSTPAPVAGLLGIVDVAAGGEVSMPPLGSPGDPDLCFPPPLNFCIPGYLPATGGHSVALDRNGLVWTWGYNVSGQLGDGTNMNRSMPAPVLGLSGVIAIVAGGDSTFALRDDGTVWSWGRNFEGQLGDGSTISRSAPAPVAGLTGVAAIAAGSRHTLALKADGTVWAWGRNLEGQLGDGTTESRTTPVPVSGLSGVSALAAGDSHTIALKQDGTVWAWGSNREGQLGDGTTISRVTPAPVPGLLGVQAIASKNRYAAAVKNDGAVWQWGETSSCDQSPFCANTQLTPEPVVGLTDIRGIAAGGGEFLTTYAMTLKQDGTVWAWGSNSYGQLGEGTYEARPEPVLVVNETTNGALDLNPEVPNNIAPEKIPPFFVATYQSTYQTRDLSVNLVSLSVDIRGVIPIGSLSTVAPNVGPLADGDYNVYVAARVPSGDLLYYYQLDSNNVWSVLTWPMADFMRGQALGSQDALIRVNILQNVDVRPYIGTSILVGYGTSADEMVASRRYRTIYTVTQPVSSP